MKNKSILAVAHLAATGDVLPDQLREPFVYYGKADKRKSQLTNKQKKSRAASKRARQARKRNRK